MLRWLLLGVATVVTGCYRIPAHEACEIRCNAALGQACPNGLTCGADNLCFGDTECSLRPDAATVDASVVDATVSPDGETCYGSGLISYCPTQLPSRLDVSTGATLLIDTGDPIGGDCTDILIVNSNYELCVLAADIVEIQGTLRATGPRPLLLFGRTTLSLTGTIDVSAGGAGITMMSCASQAGAQQPMAGQPAGGGAGGSFGGLGGVGGSAPPGTHAAPIDADLITTVRGGCYGGAGGANADGGEAGVRGAPGGAVYLLAGTQITVGGTINASGAGGTGGRPKTGLGAGGGGGGSGGLIAIDATTIDIKSTAVLLAHGGGGGGGCASSTTGGTGASPSTIDPSIPATGGFAGGTSAAKGGNGSGGIVTLGAPGGNSGSGGSGGGGGGAGAIRLYGTTLMQNSMNVYPSAL